MKIFCHKEKTLKFISGSDFSFPENFHFNESLFVGGVKDISVVSKLFKMTKGLKGAIQKANINGIVLRDIRLNAIELGGIGRYSGFPCNHSLCENGGVCIPLVNKFKCTKSTKLCSTNF